MKNNKIEQQKMQHLEFVQNVITRMNTNSFQIKQFAIAITTTVLGLYVIKSIAEIILVPIITNLILWFLDTFYLLQERKFRGLYDDIVNNKVTLYKMSVDDYTFEKRQDKKYWYCDTFKSKTIKWLYVSLIILLGIIYGLVKLLVR